MQRQPFRVGNVLDRKVARNLRRGVEVLAGAVQVQAPHHEADVPARGGCGQARPAVHTYAALSFLVEGSVTVGQGQGSGSGVGHGLGDLDLWRASAGDVMLVPAGVPHRMIESRAPVRWSLGFCVSCFAGELAPLLTPFDRARAGGSPVISIAAERRGRLEGWLGELEAASRRRDRAGEAVQRSLLTLVLDELSRATVPALASASVPASPPSAAADGALLAAPAQRELVAASLRFIELHCLQPLSLGDVAAAMRRSPAHLTTVLRRATGRSAVQWIIAGRMAEARRRLRAGQEPIEHIAERVGYADATHFIRLFRREHGMTPAAWRASR